MLTLATTAYISIPSDRLLFILYIHLLLEPPYFWPLHPSLYRMSFIFTCTSQNSTHLFSSFLPTLPSTPGFLLIQGSKLYWVYIMLLEERKEKGEATKNRSVRHFAAMSFNCIKRPCNLGVIPVTNTETSLRLENVPSVTHLTMGCAEVRTWVRKDPRDFLFPPHNLCHFSLQPRSLKSSNSTLPIYKWGKESGKG